MKSFESDIKKLAEKTRLKAMEREAIRERVLAYMEYHPLKKESGEATSVLSPLQQQDFVYISWSSLWVKVTSGALAFILIVGVPLLAERSVPGDILYLVKTGVNEGIQTQFATSPYEKVELETKLIERRIAEARLLASEGKLTVEVEAQIAETVKGHANAVQSGLAELRESDADGAAIAEIVFNSSLEVQSAVLEMSGSTSPSTALLDMVNTVRDEVASDENLATASYDGLLARIELETTRSYELFESVKQNATDEEITDVERRLADIDRSIVGAKELKDTDETAAVTSLTNVLGLIQKLIAFMTDIDIRESVELETLVPVVLTPEERTLIITTRLADIDAKIGEVDMQIASITDDGLREKMVMVRGEVDTHIASTTEALSTGDLDTASYRSGEATKALTDIITRLTAEPELPVPGVVPDETEEVVGTTTPDGTSEDTGTTTESISTEELGEVTPE